MRVNGAWRQDRTRRWRDQLGIGLMECEYEDISWFILRCTLTNKLSPNRIHLDLHRIRGTMEARRKRQSPRRITPGKRKKKKRKRSL